MSRINPFAPGNALIDARLFVGRLPQLEAGYRLLIQTLADNPRHTLITGERGIGKSWLATAIAGMARGERAYLDLLATPPEPFPRPFLVGYHETRTGEDISSIAAGLIRPLKQRLAPSLGQITDIAEVTVWLAKFRFRDHEPANDVVDKMIASATEIWKEAQGHYGGLLLVLDELDEASADPGLASFCKVLISELARAGLSSVCLLGVGLDGIFGRLAEQHPSAPRLFAHIGVPPLSEEESLDLIDTALIDSGMSIQEGAAKAIARIAQGRPFEVQRLGSLAFDRADIEDRDEITGSDVESVEA